MSIKRSVRAIKNIFQDAIVKIPYFAEVSKPSTTIAIVHDKDPIKQYQENLSLEDQFDELFDKINKQKGVVGLQTKLYYDRETICKTIIVQFDTLANTIEFYKKYAKNYDKSIVNNQANTLGISSAQSETNSKNPQYQYVHKYLVYFCKDLTPNGTNMEQILFQFGKISIQTPQSPIVRNMIKQVAKLVVVDGIRAEQQIQSNKNLILPSSFSNLLDFMNPKYLSSESHYYRWRVYSYLQGDYDHKYRVQPYQLTQNGPLYFPPQQISQKYHVNYRIFGLQQRQFFTKLIQGLTTRKYHIEEAMVFCIENISAAIEICCIISIFIVQSCMKLSSQKQTKNTSNQNKHLISLFYLISDILFNSTSTVFIDFFTVLLPPIMEKLPAIPQLTVKIVELLELWSKKFILQEEFLKGLQLIVKKQLPSMQPLGMQQMTRSQHECYKDLIKIDKQEEIEEMCWKYGIVYNVNKIGEVLRNLSTVLASDKSKNYDEVEPEPGSNDGEPLNQKDLLKIKTKACKLVICQDYSAKHLFEKQSRNSKSISYQQK